MILSVSRRCDIPAFYLEWLLNRLDEGYVLVRNPMSYHQVSKIALSPSLIDCIVFWTKDPTNILEKLSLLSEYKYYFQITINGYDNSIERNVPSKTRIIESFKTLSERIGKHKTIWRYDPIIITDKIDIEYHYKQFNMLASQLKGYTDRCIISFVDMYEKTERNMKSLNVMSIDDKKMYEIAKLISQTASVYGIKIETCSETIDLSSLGIEHTKCIDDRLISRIVGQNVNIQKDKNQRDVCGCVTSIDVGTYNTCKHGCLYCYANFSDKTVKNNVLNHDPKSPLLIGQLGKEDIVTVRKMESYIDSQISMNLDNVK